MQDSSTDTATVSLHIVVFGNVQGVFFRAGTISEARKLGINGWVRNNPDGSVEIMAQGSKASLVRLLDWCSHGPDGALVKKIEHEWCNAGAGEFAGFRIRQD
jgi:acylphosphatase